MAERKMLRQVMSPSDVYAHAESICDMLREQYGSYDADSLEEVFVDETFVQRLKSLGYDLLGEGDMAESAPLPRRDAPRMDVNPSSNIRRPGGDRSVPMRRAGSSDSSVPMRRRDGANDGSVPLRRSDRNEGGTQRRRENGQPSDGMSQMRRRETSNQGDGVPMRRREPRPAGDMLPSPPSVDTPSGVSAPTPRRGWDAAREEATPVMPRREHVTPQAASSDGVVERQQPAAEAAPVQPATPAQELPAPVVEAPVQDTPATAEVQTAEATMVQAPAEEAPAKKPAPRTRRTARARTKADPGNATE